LLSVICGWILYARIRIAKADRLLSVRLGNPKIGRMLLIGMLATGAVVQAQEAPVGLIQEANRAHVRETTPVSGGASFYAGEELSTEEGGMLALSVGSTGFRLLDSSRAAFYRGAAGPVAELRRGTLIFRKEAGGENFEIVASDVRIVSNGEEAATGQVAIVSECDIRVTSVAGRVDVTSGKQTHAVNEKDAYRVVPEVSVLDRRASISPDDPGYHESHTHKSCAAVATKSGALPRPTGWSPFFKIATGTALLVVGISVWQAFESPSHP
jgi:hypothetical protein